jgi:hypothetical protein
MEVDGTGKVDGDSLKLVSYLGSILDTQQQHQFDLREEGFYPLSTFSKIFFIFLHSPCPQTTVMNK